QEGWKTQKKRRFRSVSRSVRVSNQEEQEIGRRYAGHLQVGTDLSWIITYFQSEELVSTQTFSGLTEVDLDSMKKANNMDIEGEIIIDKEKLTKKTKVHKSFFTQLDYHFDV